jgi:hypothetical protein
VADDGRATRAQLHEAAVRTIRAHRDGGRCPECGPDGACARREWAARWLATVARRPTVGLRISRILRSIGGY